MTALRADAKVSGRSLALQELTGPLLTFMTRSTWARRRGEPGVLDFTVGNPQEMPLPGYVDALRRQLEPRDKDWFAYQMSDAAACAAVAAGLAARLGAPFQAEDVLMTTGAFAGLSVTLKTLIDPGDEVIFLSPPWFFYEALIAAESGVPVRVRVQPPAFELDPSAVASAITLVPGRSSSTRPTTRPVESTPRPRCAPWPRSSRTAPPATSDESTCFRTRRTAASSSTGARSTARPVATPGRC